MADSASATADDNDIWTIGHWTCPQDVVLETLGTAGIELLVDVRKMPGSRRSPQFDADEMTVWLDEVGVEYLHLSALSGRRPKQKDIDPTLNAGWKNVSFKNYADYTLTPEFEAGVNQLMSLASAQNVAILCGEPMPWRCHRLLIANSLSARDWTVTHLINGSRPKRHVLGQWGATPAVSRDGVLTYPDKTDHITAPKGSAMRRSRTETGSLAAVQPTDTDVRSLVTHSAPC